MTKNNTIKFSCPKIHPGFTSLAEIQSYMTDHGHDPELGVVELVNRQFDVILRGKEYRDKAKVRAKVRTQLLKDAGVDLEAIEKEAKELAEAS